ncbi:MAG: hypothetical protein RLZZ227_1170 [Pseudomonadota bacterium]|jgi:ABC-type transporter Mla MlaB component
MAAVKKKEALKKEDPKKDTPKEEALKEAAPRKAAPRKAAPRRAAPKEVPPKKAVKAAPAELVMALVQEVVEVAAPVEPVAARIEATAVPVKRAKNARYLLPNNMEIAALGPVHAELMALKCSNDGPFVLDGANLSVIDAAGLQLLVSFVTTMQAEGRKISWDNYSVQAYQLASELGVVDQLGD